MDKDMLNEFTRILGKVNEKNKEKVKVINGGREVPISVTTLPLQPVLRMKKEDIRKEIHDLMEKIETIEEFTDKLYEVNIDILDTDLMTTVWELVDMNIKQLLQRMGIKDEKKLQNIKDTFDWYVWEFMEGHPLKDEKSAEEAEMWDEMDNPICYNEDSLVDYMIEETVGEEKEC